MRQRGATFSELFSACSTPGVGRCNCTLSMETPPLCIAQPPLTMPRMAPFRSDPSVREDGGEKHRMDRWMVFHMLLCPATASTHCTCLSPQHPVYVSAYLNISIKLKTLPIHVSLQMESWSTLRKLGGPQHPPRTVLRTDLPAASDLTRAHLVLCLWNSVAGEGVCFLFASFHSCLLSH